MCASLVVGMEKGCSLHTWAVWIISRIHKETNGRWGLDSPVLNLSASYMVSGRTLLLLWIWRSGQFRALSELLTKSPFFVCCCVYPSFLQGGTKHNNNNWCVSLIIPHAERPILASFPLCLWLLVSAFLGKGLSNFPSTFWLHAALNLLVHCSFPWEKLSEHRSLVKK